MQETLTADIRTRVTKTMKQDLDSLATARQVKGAVVQRDAIRSYISANASTIKRARKGAKA